MTADPHRAALMASLTWGGTFQADLHIVEDSLAECHAVMAELIRKFKFPRTKSRRRDLNVTIHHAQASTFEMEARETHQETLATHAHGLTYALCEGTPELFGNAPAAVETEATPEPVKAATPAPAPAQPAKSHTRRPTKRFQNVQPVYTVPIAVFAKTGGI